MLNREEIRREFHFFEGKSYLNIAATSLPPKRTQDAMDGYMRGFIEMMAHDKTERSNNSIIKAKEMFAKLLKTDVNNIAAVKNTAEGMSIIAQGYPFKAGQNIVVADMEHIACIYPWVQLAEEKGVELKILDCQKQALTTENILALMDENTAALAISAVQFTTGYYADILALGEECKRRGILFIVDAIQACGRLVIEPERMNIDFLTCGSHKGLLGIAGAGFIYCSEGIVDKVTPSYNAVRGVAGVKFAEKVGDRPQLIRMKGARKFETSTMNFTGLCSLSSGIEWLLEMGVGNIEAHILKLELEFRTLLKSLGIAAVDFESADRYSGIISVPYNVEFESEITDMLLSHHVYITMRGGSMRFSFGFHNSDEDIKRVTECLTAMVKHNKAFFVSL